jgi:hypothetical protein
MRRDSWTRHAACAVVAHVRRSGSITALLRNAAVATGEVERGAGGDAGGAVIAAGGLVYDMRSQYEELGGQSTIS